MRSLKVSILIAFPCLIFGTFTFSAADMLENNFELSTENQLSENFNPKINDFWEKNSQSKRFMGADNKEIYTVAIKTGNSKAIVISQGRNESTLKYKEVAYDLSRQGYDLYLIDHRGQGFSERLGGDKYRGHVTQFQNYVDDFNLYVMSLDLQKNYQQRYLLSHSMGGTITALYLEQYPHPFQASVFVSPMFSINLGGIPTSIAKIITYSSAEICSWFSDQACYIFFGGAYQHKTFAENEVTSSELRFYSAQHTFIQDPETQLGSPTMRWVSESISATEQAVANASKISVPVLIIQAGADTVVTRDGQTGFSDKVTFCKNNNLLNISGAKHEILLESDRYRVPALSAALHFFEKSQQGKITCTK
ncbi:alpha/beta fold hydrolase [Psychromonas antarctica]|jgi:lysophospholipase|uniref:alpha/beta fold hydrolase n=1 Tax=Psychromonas antarctica TaxID=67573 RepID=UPI001EE7C016|nr:alpha/beta fold hydrolase [Psychromonas antarctica]MCG6201462.1 alpha/beta fold hydrolase [Psychromonas antarctica]